jgi:hypothetical protein
MPSIGRVKAAYKRLPVIRSRSRPCAFFPRTRVSIRRSAYSLSARYYHTKLDHRSETFSERSAILRTRTSYSMGDPATIGLATLKARQPGLDLLRTAAILLVAVFHIHLEHAPRFLLPVRQCGWMGVCGPTLATPCLRGQPWPTAFISPTNK